MGFLRMEISPPGRASIASLVKRVTSISPTMTLKLRPAGQRPRANAVGTGLHVGAPRRRG
eukprot:5599353-Amphidinium_carterae.1